MPAPLTAPSLATPSRLAHGFFTRRGGVSTGIYASLNCGQGSKDDRTAVRANRARVAAALAARDLVTAHQTHSAIAIVAERAWDDARRPFADAVVTATPGLAVGVLAADCAPVLFADADAGVVGAAHAGWRGALTGVLEATISAMERLGATRARIVAAMGPLIRQANYEVGPEFLARFRAADEANERFFAPAARAGHALFDLAGYIASRLAAAGVRCEDIGRCTYAEAETFYSYRRSVHRAEGDYGRHVNAIALVD